MRQTPAFGTPSHASSVSAPGGRPDFASGNPISSFLGSLLGPGGMGRTPGNVMSPGAGVPVPGMGHAPMLPPHGGPGIPFQNGIATTSNSTPWSQPAVVSGGQTNAGLPTQQQIPGLPGNAYAINSGAPQSIGGPGQVAPPQPFGGTQPGPAPVTSNGLVPLGNGMYYLPGQGVVGTPMGGLGAGVRGIPGGSVFG